jgi:hypothetical protein
MTPKESIDKIVNSPEFLEHSRRWHERQARLGYEGFTPQQNEAYRQIRARQAKEDKNGAA